jgi:hypothetical protein
VRSTPSKIDVVIGTTLLVVVIAAIWLIQVPIAPERRAGISFGILLLVALVRLGMERQRQIELPRDRWSRGKCFRCGYDLRKTRQRCPECGTPRPLTYSEVDWILQAESQAKRDAINRVDRWPREVLLALWFVVPFLLTLVTCWRWSMR